LNNACSSVLRIEVIIGRIYTESMIGDKDQQAKNFH